ncbi:hypothetical protein KZO25_16830 [Halomonas sp. ANAO-440]|uniref:hypothetical protein n=1 Tax=Halomonas sp. ANAO-440 TaxID=2861360 RepID=UPI001CAA4A49|nr:hypothetical protein [Halomonas sp. ANAO-440]MBZ0331984.1 hypothetical protein [Halomonas sp. ANAO-440]
MMDLILLFILLLVYLMARLLEKNVKRLGGNAVLLAYSVIMFFIFALGEAVDKERFFEKTAFSIILIFAMVAICAVFVWRTVSKLQKY